MTRPTTDYIRLCLYIPFLIKSKISQFLGSSLDLVFAKGNTAPISFHQNGQHHPYVPNGPQQNFVFSPPAFPSLVWISHNGYKFRRYFGRCFPLCNIWSEQGTISLRFVFFLYFCLIWLLFLKESPEEFNGGYYNSFLKIAGMKEDIAYVYCTFTTPVGIWKITSLHRCELRSICLVYDLYRGWNNNCIYRRYLLKESDWKIVILN